MDPNNNQPINTSPFGQTTTPQPVAESQPVAPLPSVPETPVQQSTPSPVTPSSVPPAQPTSAPASIETPDVMQSSTPQVPKSGGKKGIMLIIILLILALGMAGYVLFAKNQINNAKKATTENASIVIPTPTITPTPTPATVEQINVASPEADLKSIETDVQGL